MTQGTLFFAPGGRVLHALVGPVSAVSLSIFVAGCGGLPASVEGRVTLDGRPLPAATVSFHPDAPGPVAYGVSGNDGVYSLRTGAKQTGLEAGSYRVTVFAMKNTDKPENPGKLLTPPLYGDPAKTPLRVQVAQGSNQIPLALESVAKASDGTASREAPAAAR